MTVKAGRGGLRRTIPSARWNEDQNVCPIIQGDILGDSIDKDMYYERTEGVGARKYLRESYYHHIECFAANSLAALMRKWCLNSSFQPYSYSLETLRKCWCDRDQHQQSNLHVEGKDKGKWVV